MKKSKLSVGLVASFIGALALSACNTSAADVTAKDGSLVEFIGYNSETDKIEIKTDEIYKKYSDTKDGTKMYYDAILEALIRYEYPKLSEQLGSKLKSFQSLKTEAEQQVSTSKQTARENARSNGTSYDEEWESILKGKDCETENDLYEYYLFQLEKEEITDAYFKAEEGSLKDQYLGVNSTWEQVEQETENVDPVYPYHILHILVSLDAAKDNYNRGEISESNATKLWEVVKQLVNGEYSFQRIAANKTSDTGSKDKYGDVEIMSTKTSFYNEFKLGIYAYDALLSGVNSNTSDTNKIYEAFGIGDDAKVEMQAGQAKEEVLKVINTEMVQRVNTPISYTTIPTVPYDVFRRIGESAKSDKIGANYSPEAGNVVLPRNVLYNQFLNFHSPFLITDEDIFDNGSFTDDSVTTSQHDFVNGGYLDADGNHVADSEKEYINTGTEEDPVWVKNNNYSNNWKLASTNFIEVELPAFNVDGSVKADKVKKNVLADKDGNVVIGVRSESGIHFMVMRKSVFKGTNEAVGRDDTTLQDYYTTYLPTDSEYPTGKQTFVNMVTGADKSYYNDRVDTIKNEIKSSSTFDAAFDYRIYEYLMNTNLVKGKIVFTDSDVEKNIDEYIALLRETKHYSDAESINTAWQSYLKLLRYQNNVRDYEGSLVHTTCAFKFNEDGKQYFEKGNECYVESK